jgi:peptidoglycan/LPS O-acetylase OafA/YrhL
MRTSGGEQPVSERESLAVVGAPPRRHQAFPCFDGLRAIAAVSVIIVHTSFPTGFSTRNHFWGAYTSRLEVGVAVFFLISGFLLYRPFVAAHLGDRPVPAVRPYLKRRLLRIVPAYWVALFFAAFVLHTVNPPIRDLKSIVIYFGFLQIYFPHYVLHGINAAWTLCVEMSFYLFLPLYAWAVARWVRRSDVATRLRCELLGLVGLIAVSIVWRAVVYAHPSGQQTSAGTWLPAQLDQFALGMGLAVASVWWSEHRKEPAVFRGRWIPPVSWAIAVCAFWAVSTQTGLPRIPIYLLTFGEVLARQWLYAAFAFFLLIPAVFGPQDKGVVRGLLRSRPMVAIGLISYGIYLWHETWMLKVLDWLHRPLFQSSFLTLTLAVAGLSVLSAAASYVLIEQPFQRLGRRRARKAPPAPAAVELTQPISVDGGQPTGVPVPAAMPPG